MHELQSRVVRACYCAMAGIVVSLIFAAALGTLSRYLAVAMNGMWYGVIAVVVCVAAGTLATRFATRSLRC